MGDILFAVCIGHSIIYMIVYSYKCVLYSIKISTYMYLISHLGYDIYE